MDNNIQISAGGTSILPSSDGAVVDYEFPPTNYQSAPQPTVDTEDVATAAPLTYEKRIETTPAQGKLIWDTTLKALYVGDGVTKGGVLVEAGGSGGDFTSVTFWQNATK